MSIFDTIRLIIGGGTAAYGAYTSAQGAKQQADAYRNQSAQSLDSSRAQAVVALELAAVEADLLLRQGALSQDIATANAALAAQNAEWENRAGQLALAQAKKKGEAGISTMRTAFAAQGRQLDDTTPNLMLEEAFSELDKDLSNVRLTSESAAERQRGQAHLFSLQGARERELANTRASGRLRQGEIEANSLTRTGSINSATALTRASSAQYGVTNAYISGLSNFGDALVKFGQRN